MFNKMKKLNIFLIFFLAATPALSYDDGSKDSSYETTLRNVQSDQAIFDEQRKQNEMMQKFDEQKREIEQLRQDQEQKYDELRREMEQIRVDQNRKNYVQ